ncbi:F-box only protein 43 [Hyperolius riggenbachi]|uniref:F-box only protein 43 n=1 Tax=Hyperolius riggenbachi TaxID=752182 RepID=UPI0035A3A3C6
MTAGLTQHPLLLVFLFVFMSMDSSHEPGCWSFLQGLKAYRRKKQEMAYRRSVQDSPAANYAGYVSGAKKHIGYKESQMGISQDSGYNESLKTFGLSYDDTSNDFSETNTLTQYEDSENVDPTFVCSPIRSDVWECGTGTKKRQTETCETPRVAKKDFSLRRRLLLAKATSGGSLDFESSVCSSETSRNKNTPQRLPSFGARVSNNLDDTPKDVLYKPLATSTLKAEPDTGTVNKKWRMSFAQQRSSTIDDSKYDTVPFPEVNHLSPVQCTAESPTDSILSFNENTPEIPATPVCSLNSRAKEDFQTPISDLSASFRFALCTPTEAQISDLENSVTEDSAFHSLSFDKSQDSITDHEGSFQELIQNKETPKSAPSNTRPRKLDRCRRLSTLRERGSQSEIEDDYTEANLLSSSYKSKVARDSVTEENELSFEDSQNSYLLKVEDLTGTPALRVVHEILSRSIHKKGSTLQDLLGGGDSSQASEDVLAVLIGRKMGLEKVDVLSELKFRNLRHILHFIFKLLDVKSICSIWNVSKEWREMIVQDRSACQRRKVFMKKLRTEAEQGRLLSSEDAATRLHALNRSALKAVQAQARIGFHTPTSCGSLTPKDITSVPQSRSKQQEYVKIAKTLFTDEALKPCPQCQYPAKYQPLKKRGKCSREDCGFDFCILCLCSFHGSKECGAGSGKRPHTKKDILPGSAQSKRNLRRL